MFQNHYLDWNQKRIKHIVDFYGHKFFYFKKVLDLGCGHAEIGGTLYRLGSDTTVLDARPEHLKIVTKKFPGIKTVKADLDRGWPFQGKNFDLVIDLGLMCHLKNFEEHLRTVCSSTTHLVLETSVLDSEDPYKSIEITENKAIYDLSINGIGCRPTAAAIERILTDCGMNFRRQDSDKYNCGNYVYDWKSQNNEDSDFNKRRIWYAVKNSSAIQFSPENRILVSVPEKIVSKPIVKVNKPDNVLSLNNKFVVVIPSYNNIKWCEKNIESVLEQNYDNFRIIYTDDCSKDGTFEQVQKLIRKSPNGTKCTMIKNDVRLGAMENLYNMIHSCEDDEIIVTLDGDDWLANDNILSKLNDVYGSGDIWMTYGQYQNWPNSGIGISAQYPDNIIKSNSFREYKWCASHLRSFYTWLFKKIKKEDLMKDGKFFVMTYDLLVMYPLLEMSKFHSKFISDVLYMYNMDNIINDHKVNRKLQHDLDLYIRKMPKYHPIEKPITKSITNKPNVGLLLIATGKYDIFVQNIISSADKFFLNEKANVTYYLFTDKINNYNSSRKIVQIPIEHKSFPFASMNRFMYFTDNANKFIDENYLYYVDVDCLFVDKVEEEIFGDLVGVQHCGFFNKIGPVEVNTKSALYVDDTYPKKYKIYYGGGFSGGKKDKYLELSKWCKEIIDIDLGNNIIPIWADETVLNRYFLDHEPNITLSPSYHFPASNKEYYKSMWGSDKFDPKILLLDKNHDEIRK